MELIRILALIGGAVCTAFALTFWVALIVASRRAHRADMQERHRLLNVITGENPAVSEEAHRD